LPAALRASAQDDGRSPALRASAQDDRLPQARRADDRRPSALRALPVTSAALLWPALEELAREAVLHQPAPVDTTWNSSLRTVLTRAAHLRRVALAGAPATTLSTLVHLAAESALSRRRATVLAIAGEPPALALRRILAWAARLPYRALVDGALDETQLRAIGRAAGRVGADTPLSFLEGYRKPERLAEELRTAVQWLIDHHQASRSAPGLLAVGLHALHDPLALSSPRLRPLREVLYEIAHEPRVQLLIALPFPNGVPITPPLPQLPASWRSWLDGTMIHTGWASGEASLGGVTLHLERHVDGAVARAHGDLHPSGRLLPYVAPRPAGL
jgi:hypothetical protein